MSRTFVTRFAALATLPVLLLLLASPARGDARPAGRPHPPLHHPHRPGRVGSRPTWRREWTRCTRSTPAGSRNSSPDRPIPQLQVFLFARQADYLHFTNDRLRNTGGVYIPKRNLLAAFLEGQGRDGLRRTLQHEAFHQFAYNCVSPNLPVWLNEGLAQLFEEGIWNGESFWLGQAPPRRIRQLQSDLKRGKIIDFESMLRLTSEQWAANLVGDHDLGATEYNQSWAMVYFLVHAKDKQGNEKFRGRLIRMLQFLHDGRDGESAFREAFSDNIRGFQDRFNEYAAALEPTSEATLMDRQGVLGDLLAELAKRGRRFTSFPSFKRAALAGGYRMHYTKGELQWDSDPDLRIYFADLDGRALPPEQLYFEPRDAPPSPTSSAATPTNSSSAPASTPAPRTSSNTRSWSNPPITVAPRRSKLSHRGDAEAAEKRNVHEGHEGMSDPYIQNLFADRIGGRMYGKGTEIYKFEKIKRAKRAATGRQPGVELIDMGVGEPDEMAFPDVRRGARTGPPATRATAATPTTAPTPYKQAAARWMRNVCGVEGIDPDDAGRPLDRLQGRPVDPPRLLHQPRRRRPDDHAGLSRLRHPLQVLGGEVHNIPLLEKNHFLPDLTSIPADKLKRAKTLVINYPNNPTGASATPEFFAEVVGVREEAQPRRDPRRRLRRAGVRGQAALVPRDAGRDGRRRRAALDEQGLQHDRLAARVRRRQPADREGLRRREGQHRLRPVPRHPAGLRLRAGPPREDPANRRQVLAAGWTGWWRC